MRSKPVVRRVLTRLGRLQTDNHVATQLARTADAPDQGTEARRVDKGHPAHVDNELRAGRQLGQRLAELAHRERVELADGPANRIAVGRLFVSMLSTPPPNRPSCAQCTAMPDRARNRDVPKMLPVAAARYPRMMPELLIATDSPAVFDEVSFGCRGARCRACAGPVPVGPSYLPLWIAPPISSSPTSRSGPWAGIAIAMDLALEIGWRPAPSDPRPGTAGPPR